MKNISEKNEKIIISAAFAVFSCIYLSLVWNSNVWMDEAFSASLVHTDFSGVIKRSMADTLPPLYNILLFGMTKVFGYSIPVMKITSVIPMLLTLVLGAVKVRRRFSLKTALLFMTFITLMPLMLYFGVEIRMYSLGFFFATGSGIYAYEAVKENTFRSWAGFTVFSVLAGYTHHFAFVTAGFSYLYVLIYFIICERKRLKSWFICLLATIVLYTPCLIITLRQISRVSGYFSMPDIDLPLFVQYMAYPYISGMKAGTVLAAALMAASLVIFAYGVIKGGSRNPECIYAGCCFTVYYGVLIFGTVVSKIMSANIFVDRYMFFATGLLWLFAAIMLSRSDRTFIAAAAISVAVGACTYAVTFSGEYATSADEEIAFLSENINEGDVLYCIGGHEELQNCIPFYTYVDGSAAELTFMFPLDAAADLSEKNGSDLWIAVLDGASPDDSDLETLEGYGLCMEKEADFEFDRYRCEFYKAKR
ncbi:MAG: glycosyltransferase family 39 protein [Lachnospiraceae bacterium]|nr:glycosyltransferase family 39 protein [Lachnospiraceae bacterium]